MTRLQELLGLYLHEPVLDYITRLRQEGLTYERIALTIHERTGQYVTKEIIRRWDLANQRAKTEAPDNEGNSKMSE